MSYDYNASPNPKRFYRSRTNSVIAGVCGGIGDYFSWDPVFLRIGAVLLFFVTGPALILCYLVAWIVTPKRPFEVRLSPEEDQFWRGVSQKPTVTFSNLRYKFRDLDERLQDMEKAVTSDEWRLRRQFKDLEGGA